jgi:hypothetical protein
LQTPSRFAGGCEPLNLPHSAVFIMKKQIFLHIGSYKTGSTSIQRFLLDHAELLRQKGIAFYHGQFSKENHLELYVAALRYERDSFAKLGACKHITFDANFTHEIGAKVQRFLCRCHEPAVVLTSEGLSLLRYPDEIDRLRVMLDAANAEVKVILYLRNKKDFLRSYTNQLLKVKGRTPSKDFNSALYVEPDTWLTDYDALIATYERGFGARNVIVIDYDEQMKGEGNVIPSFLRVLGIDAAPHLDVASYFLNTTNKSTARKPNRPWNQRLIKAWNKWTRRRAA